MKDNAFTSMTEGERRVWSAAFVTELASIERACEVMQCQGQGTIEPPERAVQAARRATEVVRLLREAEDILFGRVTSTDGEDALEEWTAVKRVLR